MKQSERRHFKVSGCDCRECVPRGFQHKGYVVLVAIFLSTAFIALIVFTNIVK